MRNRKIKLYLALDIKGGRVVWGYRGERESYESINKHSVAVSTSSPTGVLKELKPKRVYVADLDAISGKGSFDVSTLAPLVGELIVDRGYKKKGDAEADLSKFIPVLGSETYDLRNVFDGVFVSLDFKNRFLGGLSLREALEILNSYRLRGVIVLDISRVGTGKLNIELVEKVASLLTNPIYVGGGISDLSDIERLEEMGVEGAILATAIHRGKIPPDVLRW